MTSYTLRDLIYRESSRNTIRVFRLLAEQKFQQVKTRRDPAVDRYITAD